MRRLTESLRNERGTALPVALMAMAILVPVLLAYAAMTMHEPLIARNHVQGTQALHAAEAGVEQAHTVLTGSTNWSALLRGPDGLANTPDDGLLPFGDNVAFPPGVANPLGTYSVRIRNDNQQNDNLITGLNAVDGGDQFTDTNSFVILTATGRVGTAARTVRVVMSRVVLPPFPGALNFPGNEAETLFNGNAFTVNGNDTNPPGVTNPDPLQPSIFGITVSPDLPAGNPGANEQVVENSLSNAQKDNVTGKKQDPAGQPWGNNTVAPDAILTGAALDQFINDIVKVANVKLTSTMASPLVRNNVGNSCAADINDSNCWGTVDNPKIVYVEGEPDPSSMFAALSVGGNSSGAGILVVKDGDFRINGKFNWVGVIIVTGVNVGVGFLGGGEESVYGGVISNETNKDPGFREGVLVGDASIRYSSFGINLARTTPPVTIRNWREP